MPRFQVKADSLYYNSRPIRLISGAIHYFRIHLSQQTHPCLFRGFFTACTSHDIYLSMEEWTG
ncbi:hypothetical protein ACFL6D_04450 [Spirochaetota bacterium]